MLELSGQTPLQQKILVVMLARIKPQLKSPTHFIGPTFMKMLHNTSPPVSDVKE